jgi:hypothetical protein
VRKAALAYFEGLTRQQSARQLAEVEAYPDIHEFVRDLLRLSSTAFHAPAETALRLLGWDVRVIPDGGNEKKADVGGRADDHEPAVVECKTTANLAGEVSDKEGRDVLRKVPQGFTGYL